MLYVGGMPRSGSTLIDLALGQLPGHVAVGELFYLWTAGVQRNLKCGCGQTFTECTFWRDVGAKAYGGWAAVDVPEVLRLRAAVDETKSMPFLLMPSLKPGFADDLARYGEILTKLYRAILEVSGGDIVVDSSKRPSLAYVLANTAEVDLRLVHVVRDPRGVAYSWTKTVPLPEGNTTKTHMPKWSPAKSARRWVTVNGMIGRLARRGVPHVTVRYEDFVRDPRREVQRVAELTGVADVAGALDFITDEGLAPTAHHTVQGGRIRFQEGPIKLRVDEAWRTQMPAAQMRFVSAATWPLRTRYDYR